MQFPRQACSPAGASRPLMFERAREQRQGMSTSSNPRSPANQEILPPEPGPIAKFSSVLLSGLVLVFCVWALSLPLFPTQDGPMHKYYVHVLASLLSGGQSNSAYVIRHPFPHYATQ